jgi:hypothetical protein
MVASDSKLNYEDSNKCEPSRSYRFVSISSKLVRPNRAQQNLINIDEMERKISSIQPLKPRGGGEKLLKDVLLPTLVVRLMDS